MSDAPKPIRKSLKSPVRPESGSNAALPPKVAGKRPAAKQAAARRADSDAVEAEAIPRRLPPVVVKKKKKQSDGGPIVNQPGPVQDSDFASELLVPWMLVVFGLVVTIATSIVLRPEGVPAGLWLGIRMALIGASLVITYGALFICSAVVEADYGYLSTGVPKVAAIVLTQDWVGDLLSQLDIPFVGGIVAFLVTYAMFKYFFGLDDMEAIASMFVVRVVHILVIGALFIAIMGVLLSGTGVDLPSVWGFGGDEAAVEIDDAMPGEEDADFEMQEIEIDVPGQDVPEAGVPAGDIPGESVPGPVE